MSFPSGTYRRDTPTFTRRAPSGHCPLRSSEQEPKELLGAIQCGPSAKACRHEASEDPGRSDRVLGWVFACFQKPAPDMPRMSAALVAHEAPGPRPEAPLVSSVLARRSLDDVTHAQHGPV